METTKDGKNKDHINEYDEEEEEDHLHNEKLQCRFYRKDFPEENDLVIVSDFNKKHVSNDCDLDSNNKGT
jgi:hypothetical protein